MAQQQLGQITKLVLKKYPQGEATEDCFEVAKVNEELLWNTCDVKLRTLFLSLDPYMRMKMRKDSPIGPYELNKPLSGNGVAQIKESKSSEFKPGDIVYTYNGYPWQDYACFTSEQLNQLRFRKIDPQFPPIAYVGPFGMTGLTAAVGVVDFCKVKNGDTVVVSGAAGAVGHLVGQMLKILAKDCKVFGIAGSDEKINLIKSLGFDDGINYKKNNVDEQLRKLCPNGIDLYFDNVGGEIANTITRHMKENSRFISCGGMSQYNKDEVSVGVKKELLEAKHINFEGFNVFKDAIGKEKEEQLKKLIGQWLKEGKIKHKETVFQGLENIPKAFIGMMKGQNIGKTVAKVADFEAAP